MKKLNTTFSLVLFICLMMLSGLQAQVVNVGSGSYTKTFPGTDAANVVSLRGLITASGATCQ